MIKSNNRKMLDRKIEFGINVDLETIYQVKARKNFS